MRRGHEREEGQAAFEFLLTVPFLFIFFLLLVDLGVLMYHEVSASSGARAGARFAAVNCGTGTCTLDEIRDRTISGSGGILDDSSEIDVAWIDRNGDGLNSGRGDSVVVRVRHTYNFLFFPSASIDVYSCADYRLEQRDRTSGLPGGDEC
ncbi:MAG: hypothetical protein Kow0010_00750 [Dehalococcoidia bacterium]